LRKLFRREIESARDRAPETSTERDSARESWRALLASVRDRHYRFSHELLDDKRVGTREWRGTWSLVCSPAAISNFTAVEPAEELRQPLLLQAPRRNNCREFLQLAAPPELRTKPARRALKSPKRQAPSRGRRFASIRGCCRSFKSGGVICVSGVV